MGGELRFMLPVVPPLDEGRMDIKLIYDDIYFELGSFLDTLFEINQAIEVFAHRYESLHAAKILGICLENEAVIGSYFIAGILKLNFNFRRNRDRQPFWSSVIMKVPHLGMFRNDNDSLSLYAKERFTYEEVIPVMYQSWTREKVVPEFYGSTDGYVLVLENLRQLGFYQNPHGSMLDLSSSIVVLKSMAQFHALSVKHVRRFRANLESLTLTNKANGVFQKHIFVQMTEKLKNRVLPSCSSLLRQTFDEYWENRTLFDNLFHSPIEDGFNVILHGDLHYYNLLLKNNDKNEVSECKLIDFQHVRCGSPILDLMKFLVTSVELEVFEKNYSLLFSCYLDELDRILRILNIAKQCPYGLKEITDDLEKYKLCFLFDLVCVLPIFWAGRRADFESLGEENEVDEMMSSMRYISSFKGWSKFLLIRETI